MNTHAQNSDPSWWIDDAKILKDAIDDNLKKLKMLFDLKPTTEAVKQEMRQLSLDLKADIEAIRGIDGMNDEVEFLKEIDDIENYINGERSPHEYTEYPHDYTETARAEGKDLLARTLKIENSIEKWTPYVLGGIVVVVVIIIVAVVQNG